MHVFNFLHKLSFENSFCFLFIFGCQINFLVSKIENCFWKQKIRGKKQLPNIPLILISIYIYIYIYIFFLLHFMNNCNTVGSLIFKSLIRINFTFFNCKRCIHTVTWLRDFLDKPKRTFFFSSGEKKNGCTLKKENLIKITLLY